MVTIFETTLQSEENSLFFTGCLIELGMEYGGVVMKKEKRETIDLCAHFASKESHFVHFWSYNTKTKICFLKASNSERLKKAHFVSGSAECGGFSSYDHHLQGE